MIKLDDDLLKELGLSALPPEEKKKLLAHIYETLEMRVGMKLAEQMTDAQLSEFEEFINRNDEAGALQWLESNFPNYKDVVASEFEILKREIAQVAPQILNASVTQAQGQVANPQQDQPMQYAQQPQQQYAQNMPNYPQQPSPMAPPPQYQQPYYPQQPGQNMPQQPPAGTAPYGNQYAPPQQPVQPPQQQQY